MKTNKITIKIPISVGELLDKITILSIKQRKIKSPESLRNINNELTLLKEVYAFAGLGQFHDVIDPLIKSLEVVNNQLWEVEDDLRILESEQNFNHSFIKLARSVYRLNDQRAVLKRQINEACGSSLLEEKSYGEQKPPITKDVG